MHVTLGDVDVIEDPAAFLSENVRFHTLIGEAAKGTNQEAVKAFDALGLSVRKLQQPSRSQELVGFLD